MYSSVFHLYVFIKMNLTENGKFHLFAAYGKQKQHASVSLLQAEMEKGSLFSLVSKG
jgi:hypothetical protein